MPLSHSCRRYFYRLAFCFVEALRSEFKGSFILRHPFTFLSARSIRSVGSGCVRLGVGTTPLVTPWTVDEVVTRDQEVRTWA